MWNKLYGVPADMVREQFQRRSMTRYLKLSRNERNVSINYYSFKKYELDKLLEMYTHGKIFLAILKVWKGIFVLDYFQICNKNN